ncbi:DUF732 domain-containing protein [Mycobacterium sp. 852002-51057_SCH5723018]|uniref:DUF732 domain-containing protein n=1 Tax=Mycobacterium sp. 852002-51057_SCH5723018 TaxID=1834094 RepID=UPI0008014FFC|nr:DUF732 domain-containing protein [Mycobacterium sp. 852002-51057_SCH5723018]OBG30156.1 hypothetical protein A5764_19515 [Mycobacterium sp. 852002-51057_SCH5723018]
MRDRDTIDSELRRIASARRSIRERGGQPSYGQADALLDERLGHRAEAAESGPVKASEHGVVARPRRRKGSLLRFGPLAVPPLSLLAVAAVLVVMFAAHHPDPAAQPTVVPPSTARPSPAAPKAPVPPVDIVDVAFVAALTHDGVPVPSQEYVTTHGHAVCDFLARQANLAEAVRFVQGSTIWDADQSANFTAGAVVSYCPQYETAAASPGEIQPGFQDALSDLQAVQGDLQRIQGDLQGIRDGLPAIPGRQ